MDEEKSSRMYLSVFDLSKSAIESQYLFICRLKFDVKQTFSTKTLTKVSFGMTMLRRPYARYTPILDARHGMIKTKYLRHYFNYESNALNR